MNDDHDDLAGPARQRARTHLDAATEAIDPGTRDALAAARRRARVAAQQPPRRPAPALWWGAGTVAAAALAAFVLLPLHPAGGDPALGEPEVMLTSDTDAAIADDLAFVAWLEENDDPT